jgi:hypothetical protein
MWSVRKSVYKANVLVASFSSVIKTIRIYLSFYATTLKCSSCNTSGFHDTLAGATLFPVDVRSMPCVISHIVTTTSRFAIVFKRVAAHQDFASALGMEDNPSATNSPDMIRINVCCFK